MPPVIADPMRPGSPTDEPSIRIGELARRAGIPPATLRAWERRYGIVRPGRTEGGYRLYSGEDERRLRRMVELITHGLAPAEAAREAQRPASEAEPTSEPAPEAGEVGPVPVAPQVLQDELLAAIRALDGAGCHEVLDRTLAAYGPSGLVELVVLPVLRTVGDLWSNGEVTVAQEHFGSQLIRARLQALARDSSNGRRPRLVLACPPGETHDLPLTAFGLMLHGRGRPIAMLGSDTPIATIAEAVEQLEADGVVLGVTNADAAQALADRGTLELGCPVAVGGPAATEELASAIGAELLPDEMPAAAGHLVATV